MARPSAPLLDAGDRFPRLDLNLTDGRRLSAPEGLDTPWTVLFLYRGSWCPMCRAQLTSFQAGLAKLVEQGVSVIAASADSLDKAQEVRELTGASFPIAYGLPVLETAETLGSYYDPAPPRGRAPHLQATGFLLGPGGKIVTAVYSSNVIGRLTWEEVLALAKRGNEAAKG